MLDAPRQPPLTRRTGMRAAKKFGLTQTGGGEMREIAVVVQNVFLDDNTVYGGYLFGRGAATFNFSGKRGR